MIGFSACKQESLPVEQVLHQAWVLEATERTPEVFANVPSLVHTDLYNAGFIPDPFFGDSEKQLQWIADKKWTYNLSFTPDSQLFEHDNIHLIFEGLDTYAQVKLNGREVLQTDNMFRYYTLDVTKLLKKDSNQLSVSFTPVDEMNKQKAAALPFKLPEIRAHSRKAPYQLGWDWGPTYATMGIWKPVKLMAWSEVKMKYPSVQTNQISADKALMELLADVEVTTDQSIELNVFVNNVLQSGKVFNLEAGLHQLSLPFEIDNPKLWWPNGLGEQNLYTFSVEIISGGRIIDRNVFVGAIRQIELIQEADQVGESFAFKVNGKEVFVKGANYIPHDHFPVRLNRNNTKRILKDAADVHMNMIRVWGGGVYPENDFYEICDSLGLMVWQDFMFACTMYPFDHDFLHNVSVEAEQQIKRLRRHPSLAIWCGNNEVSEGFHNWGWQRDLEWSDTQKQKIWNGYLELFESILPQIVQQHDPTKPYWPSSPSTGWGRPESLELGDVHYWGVWWGEEPFEMYQQKVGRFNSEYGFQAMPAMSSLRQFIESDQLVEGSEMLEAHQKHQRGTKLIKAYMQRDFPVPSDLDDYVYVSQLLQAHGIGMAIEAHRSNKPITMGTLYWQLNDSWPVTSWSSIDYFGTWKALHYKLRHAYAPLLLSVTNKSDSLILNGINDTGASLSARLDVDLKDFYGNNLRSFTIPVKMDDQKANKLIAFSTKSLLSSAPSDRVFLHARLFDGDQELAEAVYYFVRPKDLKLKQVNPSIKIKQEAEYLSINIKSDYLIKNLMLLSNDANGRFEDNFMDIVPGKSYKTKFYFSGEYDQPTQIDFKHLNALVAHEAN